MIQTKSIIGLLRKIKIKPSWAFAGKTKKDTTYVTHGYHRYPHGWHVLSKKCIIMG